MTEVSAATRMSEVSTPIGNPASARLFSIGLTGGIGSGKSTVADLFAAKGVTIIDTDVIAHSLTAAGGAAMAAIKEQFGTDFLTPDGALDRARMRATIFSDPTAKNQLEAILHPLIASQAELAAQAAQSVQAEHLVQVEKQIGVAREANNYIATYILYVVPLLVESRRWRERVDRILVVDCDEATQLQRVMQRSGLSTAQATAIIATQATRAERLAVADDIIDNTGDAAQLPVRVAQLHAQFLARVRQGHNVSAHKQVSVDKT